MPRLTALLSVDKIHKSYHQRPALRGVSFTVNPGEMFGLLGPNGAGKTTLLSIISGLLAADSGEVRLLGERIDPHARQARRRLGIVPQELAIYGDLSARENLAFFGKLYDLRGDTLRRKVDAVLAAIGLDNRADDRAATFSGGMQRRLNLGAALMHDPALLLLDEPTTGVDPQSRNHIFEEIRRINAAGVTVIYTSHYMEEVQSLCTRIGIIDHGRLLALGTLKELLQHLDGTIHLTLPTQPPELLPRLAELPGTKLHHVEQGRRLTLHCRSIEQTLLPLLRCLRDLDLEPEELRLTEPNLERVFLHLTGQELRD